MCATPEDLLAALAFHDGSPLPRTALEEIIRRKDEMTPYLLDSLGKCLEHPGSFLGGERQLLPVYAGYLLAQFREPRAFPLLIALFAHRSKELGELWSDTVLGDMGNLLASVYDGNETLLHTLVENPNADEYVRGNGAIGAYLALLSSGRIPSDAVETYFRELLEHKLEREPSNVWDMLATAIGELGLVNLLALIRAANEEGLCDPWCGSIEQVEELALKGGRPDWKTEYHLIEDAIGEMTDWDCFSPLEKLMSMFELPEPFDAASPKNRTTPIRVSVPVTGRNEPCPCGSGKKFKKCCGDGAAIMAKREVMLAQPLRVRISLCGTDPEVWRELVVPGRFTLLDLHRVIQLVMPWDGGHLHCFTHAGKSYYAEREWANSREDGLDHEMLLHDLNPDADLVYTYDFGDNWCHDVQVFRDAPAAADLPLPRCLGGANACPPDDVGGIGGYYHALEILKNPEAEDHDHFVEWLGADFDPTAFDVADANANLEKWGRQPRS